ncbi:HAMP domain-containing sensor histidine kinase [Streptomyces sp. B21-105]|uniref:sensor histidine kinase n=1 Tax=Streptomyces sp. B21-105 TaxID=3039417 RepID=UPI002FEE9D67
MSRRFGSVRARATLGAVLVVAVALVAAGAAVVLSLRSQLLDQADAQAERVARTVATQLSVGTAYDRLSSLDDDDRPVQVVDAAGRQVAASEDLERISGTPATEPDDDLDPGEIEDRTRFGDGSATVDGDTADYRFAAVQVRDPQKGPLTVYAGAPLSAERGAVRTALTVMLIGFPLLLAVVAGVTWLVTRRALRPVEGIRREMAAITASADLGRRVPVPDTHDEVARLARTTNETLAALESSVERQRRFVADASHELRSPIASLRTQLEVGAAHPGLLDVAGAVEDTVRLQRLAADLLLLARLDAGEEPVGGRLDLAALAREEAAGRPAVTVDTAADGATEAAVDGTAAGGAVAGGAVAGGAAGGPSLLVAGSRGQLGRVLANLLDNAQRHARTEVSVRVRRSGDRVVVEVADDGDGVPEADRERIFERFVRLDDARSRDDGGAGLGLAIARDVAARHGGTLTVGETPAGGALFELRLPAVNG